MRTRLGIVDALASFFEGKLYPILVAVIVLAGHVSGYEFYFNIIHVLLISLAFCVCRSVRPMLIVVPTFICQVSLEHTPAVPTYSDYYFTEWRLPVVVVLGVIVLLSIGCFAVRNGFAEKIRRGRLPLFGSIVFLSVAFLLNGFDSATWTPQGFAFGTSQILVYGVLFYLFYLGFSEKDRGESLIDYFSYITLIISYVMIVEIAFMFISGGVFSESGAIMKQNVTLGWATCNPLGAVLVTLIPGLFLGAMRNKYGWLYFVTAGVVYAAAITTCSRNALLFGSITFLVCMIIACFKSGSRRTAFRIILILFLVGLAVAAIVFKEKILEVFDSFVKQGANDNGRFLLWGLAWQIFSENPVFGACFFALKNDMVYESIAIMPVMAHNTILELLSSTGAVGLLAYAFYQGASAKIFIEKPTLAKSMLGIICLVIVVQSLLDVFVFCYYTMFYPIAALAVACRIGEGAPAQKSLVK